jgi:hypothetical protein
MEAENYSETLVKLFLINGVTAEMILHFNIFSRIRGLRDIKRVLDLMIEFIGPLYNL